MKKFLLSGCVLGSALLAAAPVLEVKTIKDWSIPRSAKTNVTQENGTFKVTPRRYRTNIVTGKIPLDLNKKYKISGQLRATPGVKPGRAWLGIVSYDANGKVLTSHMVNLSRGTITKLVTPAKKGDTSVLLENCADWQPNRQFKGDWSKAYQCLAFNAKPDFSDLPNRDYSPRIKKMIKQGNNYRVVFHRPLKKDYPAGTMVRNQRAAATYLYVFSGKLPAEWTTIEQIYQGDAGKRGVQRNKFWTGTKVIRLIFSIPAATGLEFRNLKIEEL